MKRILLVLTVAALMAVGPSPVYAASGDGSTCVGGDVDPIIGPGVDCANLTKDDCKNGGWQALGFKNQGDCASFVATGGKNLPTNG
jgi:hypothetical protein